MPFIRCSRDKRGYESTFVLHVYRPGQGTSKTRVLYLFRSPASLRVGRQSLDPEVMEALEHTHPDLSFDWTGLVNERDRERGTHDRGDRYDRNDRPDRDSRDRRDRPPQRPSPPPPRPAPPTPPAPAPIVVSDDQSPLGRTLGVERAAQLRARYAEVLQRVQRRARTPEELARLRTRIERLNPEEWTDEGSIQSQSQAAEAEWNAVMAELPGRRRGRRGGRNRGNGRPMAQSAIMTSSPNGESHEDSVDAIAPVPDRPADVPDDRRDVGAVAADPSEPSASDPSSGSSDL